MDFFSSGIQEALLPGALVTEEADLGVELQEIQGLEEILEVQVKENGTDIVDIPQRKVQIKIQTKGINGKFTVKFSDTIF